LVQQAIPAFAGGDHAMTNTSFRSSSHRSHAAPSFHSGAGRLGFSSVPAVRSQPVARRADHFRIGRGLVDEHQSGRIKHGLPSLPASTCPDHVRAILLRSAQAFLKLMSWRLKKLHTAVRLPAIPCLCIAETISSSVRSGCSSISVSSQGACASNGGVLPLRGLCCAAPSLMKALHPFDRRTWTDVELPRAAKPRLRHMRYPHANVRRICLRHGSASQTNQCRQTRPFAGPWESCDPEHALGSTGATARPTPRLRMDTNDGPAIAVPMM
jgi:hypothetical protein